MDAKRSASDVPVICGLCGKPETKGNLCRIPKKPSYGDQYALLRRMFSRITCGAGASDHRDCRSKLRACFSSDEEIKLLEREKRAHCYPIELLDRVLLSTPPVSCHKTCLGGLRVLIRLWNAVAVTEANGMTTGDRVDYWIRPHSSSDCDGSTRPDSSSTQESFDTSQEFGGTKPRGGSGGSGVSVPPPLSQSLILNNTNALTAPGGISPDIHAPSSFQPTPGTVSVNNTPVRSRRLKSQADCVGVMTRGSTTQSQPQSQPQQQQHSAMRKSTVLPALSTLPTVVTMSPTVLPEVSCGARQQLKRIHSNGSLLPTIPIALPSLTGTLNNSNSNTASPRSQLTFPTTFSDLSWSTSPMAGNPARTLIKRQKVLVGGTVVDVDVPMDGTHETAGIRFNSMRSNVRGNAPAPIPIPVAPHLDGSTGQNALDAFEFNCDELMGGGGATETSKNRRNQVAMQKYLEETVFGCVPDMSSARVKEFRRALYKSFKLKHPKSLRSTPPHPKELCEVANGCLMEHELSPVTATESEAYTRFYVMYTTNCNDSLDSDSFISDVSTELGQLSLDGGSNRVPIVPVPVPVSQPHINHLQPSSHHVHRNTLSSVPGFEDGEWDFPFGVHASVDGVLGSVPLPLTHPTHDRKPSNTSHGILDYDLDLSFPIDGLNSGKESVGGQQLQAVVSPTGGS